MRAVCCKRRGMPSPSHSAQSVVFLAMPSTRKCLIFRVHSRHLNLRENVHKKGQIIKRNDTGPILIRLLNLGTGEERLDRRPQSPPSRRHTNPAFVGHRLPHHHLAAQQRMCLGHCPPQRLFPAPFRHRNLPQVRFLNTCSPLLRHHIFRGLQHHLLTCLPYKLRLTERTRTPAPPLVAPLPKYSQA